MSQIWYVWPQALLGRGCPGRQELFLPSPCPVPCFFAALWKCFVVGEACAYCAGSCSVAGQSGWPHGPRATSPIPKNQPGLRLSFSSSFAAGRAPEATTIEAGTSPSQIHTCHWCWERPVPAVPSPRVLGTVWGQLMASAWDSASSTTPEGSFIQWWLSCGHGMTQGLWGLQEPQGASPGPGVGAPGDSGVRAGPPSWRISPGPPCPAGTLRRRRGLFEVGEANSSLEFPR